MTQILRVLFFKQLWSQSSKRINNFNIFIIFRNYEQQHLIKKQAEIMEGIDQNGSLKSLETLKHTNNV